MPALTATVFLLAAGSVSAATLVNRYSFDTDGTDSVGGANATIVGSAAASGGQLVLPGGSPRTNYASLPVSVGTAINSYSAVTFEAWFTTNAVQNWSKLFYFGQNAGGFANESLEFTPVKGDGSGLGKAESLEGNVANAHHSTQIYSTTGVETHIVVVFDDANDTISLYKDGVLDGSSAFNHALSAVDLPELYLGAAVGWGDADYNGSINEFRIYNGALTAGEAAGNFALGPNAIVPEPASLLLWSVALPLLRRRRR